MMKERQRKNAGGDIIHAPAEDWGDDGEPAKLPHIDNHDGAPDAISDYEYDFWAADNNGHLFSEAEDEVDRDNGHPDMPSMSGKKSTSTKQGTTRRTGSANKHKSKAAKKMVQISRNTYMLPL